MKTLKNLAVLMIVLINNIAFGQVTCNGTVFAEIVPITAASEIRPLSFGQFSPIGSGGNVVVTPQGNRMSNGSVVLAESIAHQGMFSIYGTQNNTVQVLLPTSPVYIYHQNGINYMYLDTWTVDMPKGGSSMTQKDFIVSVGSTLHIGPLETNPIGVYTCTYPITFIYN